MQNQINISGNQIIEADYDTISNFCKTIIGLCILLLLIFMSVYLFIYNALYIAYSARTAHPFQRNGAPFRFKLSKAQQVD